MTALQHLPCTSPFPSLHTCGSTSALTALFAPIVPLLSPVHPNLQVEFGVLGTRGAKTLRHGIRLAAPELGSRQGRAGRAKKAHVADTTEGWVTARAVSVPAAAAAAKVLGNWGCGFSRYCFCCLGGDG